MAESKPTSRDLEKDKLSQKVLREQLKLFKKENQGKGRDVSSEAFNRTSIRKMGAMTRKGFGGDEKGKGGFTPDDINTGFFGAALQAGKEGFGARKDAIGDKIGGIPVVGGFLNQRRMLNKAKTKQTKRRKEVFALYEKAEINNPAGSSLFETAIRKSVKDYDREVLIDVLIEMGLTSLEQIEDTLKLFSSGDYKLSDLQSEIENAASDAGVSTKTGKLGLSLKAKGVSSIGSGADVSPSSSTSGGGSGVESRLVLQELSTQTFMLQNIEGYLKPNAGDKAKDREDKLEGERDDKLKGKLNRSMSEPDKSSGDSADPGFLGGMMDTLMDFVGMGGGGGGRGRRGRRKGARARARRMRGGGKAGRISRLFGRGKKLLNKVPGSSLLGKAGGFFGNMFSKAKGLAGSAIKGVRTVAGKLNPMAALRKGAGTALRGLTSIPGLGALISTAMAAYDISGIKSDPELSPKKKKELIGRSIGQGLGGALGSIGGGVLGSFIPIPGVGTLLGAMGGGAAGSFLGDTIAEALGGEKIYNIMADLPGLGGLISVDEGDSGAGTLTPNSQNLEGAGASSLSTNTSGQLLGPSSAATPTLATQASATIDASARSQAVGSGGANINSTNTVVAPSTSVSTNNTYNTIKVAQEEPSFIASQMVNSGSKFSAGRFS
jgi:hypothetical protein